MRRRIALPSAGGAVIVCSCHAVPMRVIDAAVAAGATDVDAVGRACGAGTGCGSCRERIAERLVAARGDECGVCAASSAGRRLDRAC